MRTSEDVLAFLDDQLYMINAEFNDKGLKPPYIRAASIEQDMESLNQKYWLCQMIKGFIKEEI